MWKIILILVIILIILGWKLPKVMEDLEKAFGL